ncbi:MAG: protein-L-isoaspartate(D-aspartate) O-methyltransferase [Nanoarchaeota archaeon]|nr:MAG: protein-L-isoaspartate(D-aspartate) O-methyltransferase [Nanoarchaeota archaeon]
MLAKKWADSGLITDERVISSFLETPREEFILRDHTENAYSDYPLPIYSGQTISQPTTVMIMTQALEAKEGMKVLEIGAGSGYQAAILSKLVGKTGKVYSIEFSPELVAYAQQNLRKTGCSNVTVSYGDGSQGFAAKAPYDRIIVTAAAPKIPPPLLEQLNEGGILIIPVDSGFGQTMKKIIKKDGKFVEQELGEFQFVPLRGKYGR